MHPTLQQTGLSFLHFFRVFPYFVSQEAVWLWKELISLCPSRRLETCTFYWDRAWSSACAGRCWPVGQLHWKMLTFQVKCKFFFCNIKLGFLGLTPKQIVGCLPIPKASGAHARARIWEWLCWSILGQPQAAAVWLRSPPGCSPAVEEPTCSSRGRDPTSPPSAPVSSHPLPLHPTFPRATS